MTEQTPTDFSQIVTENKPAIFRICRAYLGASEEVDDLYQEVLINIWRALPKFRGQARLSTWIYRITINTAITYRRKNSRYESKNVSLNGHEFSISDGTSEKKRKIEQEQQIDQMMKMIAILREDERIIIGLYLEDLSYKEMGEVVGKDTNYVGVKLKRVKEKLAKMMQS